MFIRSRVFMLTAAGGLMIGGLVATAPTAGAAGSALAGTVYSHTGATLAGATVTAYAPLGHLPAGGEPAGWTPVATSITATSGAFTLAGLDPSGTYRVKAVPANLATDSYGYWVDDATITPWVLLAGNLTTADSPMLHLTAPARVRGTVTDTATGKGVPGVEVRATSAGVYADTGDPTGPGTPSYGSDYLAAMTDKRGQYTLTGLPTAAAAANQVVYGLVFTDPTGKHGPWMWWFSYYNGWQYTPEVNAATEPDAVRNAQLQPSGVLHVHVQDANRKPVAGLLVQPDSAFVYPYTLSNRNGDAYLGGLSGGAPATAFVTDPNGLTDPAHTYRTTFYGQSPNWAGSTKVSVPLGRTVNVTITVLRDAARVFGYAMSGGEPVVGPEGFVNVYQSAQMPPPDNGDLQWKLHVGGAGGLSDGWFEVTGLWPGLDLTAQITPTNDTAWNVPIGVLTADQSYDAGTVVHP